MANECVPYWDPADHITCVAGSGGVTGKKFVKPTGPLAVGLGTAGGVPAVVLPAAGGPAIGVAAQDAAAGATVMIYTEGIVPVTAGGTLTGGTFVQADATGAAVVWDGTLASAKLGVCVADAASAADAPILLY